MEFHRRHLRALVAIAEAGSIHKAAQQLGMTQPAVSRLLAEIEGALGARVVDRAASGSTPTPRGAALVEHARTLLRGLERMEAVAQGHAATVRLGCIPRAMHTLMPHLVRRLGDLHQLRVTEDASTRLHEALGTGRLDFAVMRHEAGAAGLREGLQAVRLYDEHPVVICGPQHALAHRRSIALQRLIAERWVLPSAETTTRTVLDAFWQASGLPPVRAAIESRSFESCVALTAGTDLLSIIPDSIARVYARAGLVRVLRVAPALPATAVMLAHDRHVADDPLLAGFRQHVVAAAAQVRKAYALQG